MGVDIELEPMRNTIALIFTMLCVACPGNTETNSSSGAARLSGDGGHKAPARPTLVVLPEDVIQDSIQLIAFSTNTFAVACTYTEAGAEKVLASWEADGSHYGMTPEWKKAWLKHRTHRELFHTRAAAEELVAKLKRQ